MKTKTIAAFSVLCIFLFCAGCEQEPVILISVEVIEKTKARKEGEGFGTTYYRAGSVVEVVETKERLWIPHEFGEPGDIFKIDSRKIHR